MSKEIKSKINRLVNQWPKGTVSAASYLNTLGFSHDLLVRYKKSGWIQSFEGEHLGVDIVMTRTNLFPSDSKDSLSEFKEKDFSIRISSPERATMEMLHLIPGKISFEEALLIMENLVSLRPDLVERLLVMCRSIKVKRLFMYMAEKHGHSWVSDLDLSKIDIGKGKRMIVPNGNYDRKYLITVPQDDREEISG
jgi:hypothetical protein